MKEIIDNNNNTITILDNGNVLLELISENRIRKIGIFKDNVYTKFDTEAHIFRKLNAWSIPYELYVISNKIIINTDKYTYTINTKDINPDILHFRNSGIEKKVYIPVNLWNKNLKL